MGLKWANGSSCLEANELNLQISNFSKMAEWMSEFDMMQLVVAVGELCGTN